MRRGLWGVRMEDLHVETRERVSNGVVYARNVLCGYGKVVWQL